MKYHKIKGVEKDICTAEQKIAYNIAFKLHISYQADFDRVNSVSTGNARSDCNRLAIKGIDLYTAAYDYKPGKYDIDAIFCSLNAGLYNYMVNPFIATDYQRIGRTFPAMY